MSKTLYVEFHGRGFWAYDVASSVFLKFLIDVASGQAASSDGWLAHSIDNWRVNATVSDFGFHLDDDWSQSQTDTVIELFRAAAAAVRTHGDVSAAEIRAWSVQDGLSIDARGHDPVPAEPVARFGDAVAALLEGTLPEPPERHWWCYTLDENVDDRCDASRRVTAGHNDGANVSEQ